MICRFCLPFFQQGSPTKAHEVSARSGRGQTPPDDFRRTGEEEQLGELYGLDDAQLYWRRLKIGELRSVSLFRREYPLSSHDDFVATDWDSFIRPELVMNARREDVGEPW